jgi:hypothetical protein
MRARLRTPARFDITNGLPGWLQVSSAHDAPADRVVYNQEQDGSADRNHKAVQVQPRDSRQTQQVKDPPAYDGADNTKKNIEHHAFAAVIDQVAGNQSRQKTE